MIITTNMNQITKENILSAIAEIDNEGVRSGRHSSTYDLVYKDKFYPPKLVISIANRFATGEELDPKAFSGGLDSECHQTLEKFGFEIIAKKSPLTSLIIDYKNLIRQTKMADEVYKWKLIAQFKGRPDVTTPDFAAEYKEVKFGNLIYAMAGGVGNHICREKPEEFRELFIQLFNEQAPLNQRVADFNEKSLELYRSIGETLGHHQDERTISAYLTLHNPDKYTFYKSTFYLEFCKLLDVKPTDKNEKYVHYLELLNQFIDDYIATDDELIGLVKSLIPEYYDGTNNLLLAQDILYTMLDRKLEINYKEQFSSWLNELNNEGSNKSGSYLRAIDLLQEKLDYIIYKTNDISILKELYVDLIEHQKDKKGKYFNEKFPSYGNNYYYSAAIKSYLDFHEYLIQLSEMNDSKKLLEGYRNYLDKKVDVGVNSKLSYFESSKTELNFRWHDQFKESFSNFILNRKSLESLVPLVEIGYKGGRTFSGVTWFQKYIKELLSNEYKEVMVTNQVSKNTILYGPPGTGKTYSTIDRVVEICHSDYQKDNHEHNKLLYDQLVKEGRVVFNTFHQSMAYEDFIEGIKPVKPGDDDTYLKYDIEPGVFKQISNTAKSPSKIQTSDVDWDNVNYYKMSIGGKNRPDIHNWCIENNVVGLSWGGEDDLSSLKTHFGKWENYRDSFKDQFSKTAEENRYNIQASYIFSKMKIGDIVVISKGNHIIDAIGKIVSDYYFDDATPTDMYHFRKVEWIVKDMEASPEKFIDKQISQQSIYEFSNQDVKKDEFKGLTSKTKAEDKPYVIVIDEINRGNVSAIFGELITLIEDDKRLGAKNELTVTLPYSKEKFGVPSNLYIIGTMNTADRSVEALDTALRRRFTFEEMMPQPALLTNEIIGISMNNLLTTINERIEALIDRDHTIGHAYFLTINDLEDLRLTFKDKIIPLLQEYFYGDYGKIGLVLGEGFVEVALKEDSIFSSFQYEGRESLSQTSYTLKSFEDMDFEVALNQLFNKK